MLSNEMRTIICESNRNVQLLRRALAAFFRSGDFNQPELNMSDTYVIQRTPGVVEDGFLEFVRLANVFGTFAVYRHTNRGELRRLKRWPASIEDGSAQTYSEYHNWRAEQLKHSSAAISMSRICSDTSVPYDDNLQTISNHLD